MDFGLDKLVEMIEERFGRFWGTVVLLALMLAAFAIAIHAVFGYLILPIFREGPPLLSQVIPAFKRLTLTDALYVALEIGIGLIGGLVFFAVSPLVTRRIRASAKNIIQEAQSAVNEARATAADCEAHSEKNHAEINKKLAELEASRLEFQAAIAAFRREIDQHPQDEGSGIQSPQDTGPEKQP